MLVIKQQMRRTPSSLTSPRTNPHRHYRAKAATEAVKEVFPDHYLYESTTRYKPLDMHAAIH